jgi:hypothetical protein
VLASRESRESGVGDILGVRMQKTIVIAGHLAGRLTDSGDAEGEDSKASPRGREKLTNANRASARPGEAQAPGFEGAGNHSSSLA